MSLVLLEWLSFSFRSVVSLDRTADNPVIRSAQEPFYLHLFRDVQVLILIGLVIILLLIVIIGYTHWKCIGGIKKYNFKAIRVFLFIFQTYDFWTDFFLTWLMLQAGRFYLFLAAALFLVLPLTASLVCVLQFV